MPRPVKKFVGLLMFIAFGTAIFISLMKALKTAYLPFPSIEMVLWEINAGVWTIVLLKSLDWMED